MPELTELQIEYVSQELSKRGIELRDLHEDLLDHVCTAIESRMADGESFESAFNATIKLFGPDGLMQVQEQTLLLLTQMNETMKKFSIGFGLASTALLLAGMFFKIMHWPGAGIMLLTGNFFLVALYLPVLLIHKLKESKKTDYPMLIMGFVGLGLFAAGSTFRVMHWPMGTILLWGGFLALTVGFLPMYFLRRYRSSSNRSITLTTAMLVLVAVAQVGLLLNLKNSRAHYHANTIINEVLEEKRLAPDLDMPVYAPEVQEVVDLSQTLIADLERIKSNLIVQTTGIPMDKIEGRKLSELHGTDDFKTPKRILVGTSEKPATDSNSAPYMKSQIDSFRKQLIGAFAPEHQAIADELIDLRTDRTYTGFNGEQLDWVLYHFLLINLSGAVSQISQLQLEIQQSVNHLILYEMNQSEPPRPPSLVD